MLSGRYAFATIVIAGITALAACAPPPVSPPPAPAFHPVAETAAPLDTHWEDIAVLNRVSWGASTSSAQTLAAEGLGSYLQAQLHPSPDDGLPPDGQNAIAAMEISQKSLPEINDEVRNLRETAQKLKGRP